MMNSGNEKSHFDSTSIHTAARELRARAIVGLFRTSGRGLLRLVTRYVVRPIRAHSERRRQVEELMNMDDRMLRDMGLSRGAIFHALENGREPANTNVPLKRPDAA